MKILWVLKKKFDLTVDRTTWIAIARELQALGHSVILYTGTAADRSDWGLGDALRYSRAPSIPGLFHVGFQLDAFRTVRGLMRSASPDVVIFDPLSAWGVAAAVRTHRGKRPLLVMDVRSLPAPGSGIVTHLRRRLFCQGTRTGSRYADATSVITGALRDELIAQRLLSANVPTVQWSSGVDTKVFVARSVTPQVVRELRQRVGAGDGPVFLYHGVMDIRRGLDDLVRAFAALRDCVGDGARLVFVGDGRSLVDLRSLARALGVASSTYFVGAVPHEEIPQWIAAADAGVLPFPDLPIWRTSSPIKLFEYLAMERPVVVTDIRAHRDVLGSLECAFYSPSSSPTALASTMMDFAHASRAHRELGVKEARRLVEISYTWSAQARRLAGFLEELR